MRYVYSLRNLINGKVYIGQTKNPTVRKAGHFYLARRGNERHLYASIRKHGAENFVFEVLEECTDELINEREQHWITHFDSFNPEKGYNLTRGGEGTLGCDQPKSPEHREHMRESQERYWADNPDDQRRQQLAERNRTDEARQASKTAQDRRWAKWHAEHPEQPKQLLSHEERSRRCSERMTNKKRGPYKNRGIKRGPHQGAHACKVCDQIMKFMTHTHLTKHNLTREQYDALP